jgi:hypothetical protein
MKEAELEEKRDKQQKDSITTTRLSWLSLSNLEMKAWFMAILQWLHLVLLSQDIEKLVSSAIQTAFSAAFLGFEIHAVVGTNLQVITKLQKVKGLL